MNESLSPSPSSCGPFLKFHDITLPENQSMRRAMSARLRGCGIKVVASVLAVLSVSCAASSPPSAAEQAASRSFTPPAGKCLIYVYRPSRPFTGLVKRPVFIDRQHVASTTSGSFAAIPVNPGTHAIQAGAQALFDTPEYHLAYQDIVVNLKAGQCVFIRQTVNVYAPGSQSVSMLQAGGLSIPVAKEPAFPPFGAVLEDEAAGRAACASLKQVGSPTSGR